MISLHAPGFADTDLLPALQQMTDPELDQLPFGVIGFDTGGVVRRYNSAESRLAGLSKQVVLGHRFFSAVAPCMNNRMVAKRFVDASVDALPLDATIDYMLALRARPSRVTLRLLAQPGEGMRYLLVQRLD
jgi:photoactive yellow protein